MAFTLAAMIQTCSVFQYHDLSKLALADNTVEIALEWKVLERADPFTMK
jgi:hypothetical protein